MPADDARFFADRAPLDLIRDKMAEVGDDAIKYATKDLFWTKENTRGNLNRCG